MSALGMPPSIRMEQHGDVVRLALPNHFMRRPPFEALLELTAFGFFLWWTVSRMIAVWPHLEWVNDADKALLGYLGMAVVCLVAVAYLVVGLIARDELEVQPEEIRYRRRRRVLSDLAAWLLIDMLLIVIAVQCLLYTAIIFSYEDGPVRRCWTPLPRGSYTYILRSAVEGFRHDAEHARGTVMAEACLPATPFSTVDELMGSTRIEFGRALAGEERRWLLEYLCSWRASTKHGSA